MKQKLTDMTERERYTLFAGLFFLVGILFWLLVYEPITEGRERLRNSIAKKESALREAGRMADDIIALRTEVERFEQQMKNAPTTGTPSENIDAFARAAGIGDKVAGVTSAPATPVGGYLETVVSVTLKDIPLGKLIRFLDVARQGGVRVKRMTVAPEFEDPSLLTAEVAVSFFEFAS